MRATFPLALTLSLLAQAQEKPHWSLVPPVDAPVPQVKAATWPLQPLDHFILSRLEDAGLQPSAPAVPTTLLRRLHLDLTGLPPAPQTLSRTYEETVDDLLSSMAFAERWGRHWLDVARYAESNGRESNVTFPHAWRYRDYVIDAVHQDLPFDRFILEQLAGDLLPAKDDAERARLLVATGFLAMGAKGLNEMNPAQFAADLADEQLDTVSRAFMGSSIACARCHDHKTDPYSMEDYYALAGIFKSTRTFYGNWVDSENNNGSTLLRLPRLPGQLIPTKSIPAAQVKRLKEDLAKLNAEEAEQKAYLAKAQKEGRDLSGEFYKLLQTSLRIYWTRGGIEGQLDRVDETGRALPLCMGVSDVEKVTDSPLHVRGEVAQPGAVIPRGLPAVFGKKIDMPSQQSGRLELARWIGSADHPLTARVMVNRVWRQLFGTGLVRTVDDFGSTGEAPSHPELLDHLALQLINNGWSVKKVVRQIVLSQTYRQRAAAPLDKDPDNRLLSRFPRRRLDAEAIRDSMLAVSGELLAKRREDSLVAELDGQSVSLVDFNNKLPTDLDGSLHRSVYLPVLRDHLPDVLEQFDAANPSLVTGDRAATNVPTQALYLLNGPFVQARAAALAKRLTQHSEDGAERIRHAFQLCHGRLPDTVEMDMARRFFETTAGHQDALAVFCQSLLASAEFRLLE